MSRRYPRSPFTLAQAEEPSEGLVQLIVLIREQREPFASEMPSAPIVSGMRAPPVSPKCTMGIPIAIARS